MQLQTWCLIVLGVLIAGRAGATHPCNSPVILDLDGNGVRTTSIAYGVDFDINGDGTLEHIGWAYYDGFLWLDRNDNGVTDDGSELFGNSTLLPTGDYAENGFEALAAYDKRENGGNEDEIISRRDAVWEWLRLWIDTNRDGVSELPEIAHLDEHGVVAIGLAYREINEVDGGGNLHAFRSWFVERRRELGRPVLRRQVADDVFFVVEEEVEE